MAKSLSRPLRSTNGRDSAVDESTPTLTRAWSSSLERRKYEKSMENEIGSVNTWKMKWNSVKLTQNTIQRHTTARTSLKITKVEAKWKYVLGQVVAAKWKQNVHIFPAQLLFVCLLVLRNFCEMKKMLAKVTKRIHSDRSYDNINFLGWNVIRGGGNQFNETNAEWEVWKDWTREVKKIHMSIYRYEVWTRDGLRSVNSMKLFSDMFLLNFPGACSTPSTGEK